ncbi:MAG: GGDEF domain-containing protein [Candidatus Eremiobacteraeota bacterium]|nr:GGDEF domain-containing protein [Candidatus Eremiobacteraeota bacterium]
MIASAELGIAGSLAVALASSVVVVYALRRARATERALRRACEEHAAFARAAQRLAEAARVSADAVRAEIARAVRAAVPVADGVLVFEEEEGALRCVAAFGTRFAYYAGVAVALDDEHSLVARARAAGHHVTANADGVRPLHPIDAAAIAVPLALGAGRSCVLAVAAQRPFDAGTIARIVALAEQAAPAYGIALDREADRRRAEYDGLTGLLTPRAFRARLGALVERARFVPSARLSLLFVDTDHFKRWNDRYGHAAGDTLLRAVAAALRSAVRAEHDLAARNGGDEFCLVLDGTDKADAIERAEVLRRRIAALDLTALRPAAADASPVRITASIGVAAFPADAASAADLLERADAAMYHSKHTGRDAVAYAAPDGTFARLDGAERIVGAKSTG